MEDGSKMYGCNPGGTRFKHQQLHLVALPHTQVSHKFITCAYTQKVLKFCKMMGDDYDIKLYTPEGPAVEGAELIPCLSNDERLETFGQDDLSQCPTWPTDEQTIQFNCNAIKQISDRLERDDLLLLTAGLTHQPIANALKHPLTCEPGVGYEGICTSFCAFESYAWQHHIYAKHGIQDGRWFDTVIPNYFDPEDFEPVADHPWSLSGEPYLLFIGRLVARKAPHVAAQIADACCLPLVVAGPGVLREEDNKITAAEVQIAAKRLHYYGVANRSQRCTLMRGAKAVIVPTAYVEPFGGVAVEAMMCGTPVLTTDWGAFTETVVEGLNGFRFRTMRQAVRSIGLMDELNRTAIHDHAMANYSLDAVRPRFKRWFDSLLTLNRKEGWYRL